MWTDEDFQYVGTRDLSEREIVLLKNIAETGDRVRQLLQEIQATPDVDLRWAAIAQTDLQKGFMSLARAVVKPKGF